jgi:hypothetical protein
MVDAKHLPFRPAGRGAHRRRRCDDRVVERVLDRHQFRPTSHYRSRAQHAHVLGLAGAASSKDRPAGDCRFDILDR